MWNYEGMSWSERIANVGAALLGGIASFVFFCLSNLRILAGAILASVWFSAYWTMMHPKPLVLPAERAAHAPPAPATPAANVLYPSNYKGPNVYGVPQNK